MARLRLFANLREVAGTAADEVPGDTVGAMLEVAGARYGDQFTAGLGTARIWVNGEPATESTPVTTEDEVAIIPPVSGGAPTLDTTVETAATLLPLSLLAALFIAAWIPVEGFVIIAVGSVLAWVWDIADVRGSRDAVFNIWPALIACAVVGSATYAWGFEGFAGGLALALVVTFTWPVFDAGVRDIQMTAITGTAAVTAGVAVGGLVLLRMMSTTAAAVFVIVVVVAIISSTLAQTYGNRVQSLDPNVGALLGALVAGLLAGVFVGDIDLAAALIGAVAIAAVLIGGHAYGSVLRNGTIVYTLRPPGVLSPIDGVLLAAPLFWLTLWVFG